MHTKTPLFAVFMGFLCLMPLAPAAALNYVDPQLLTPQLLPPPPAEGSREFRHQLDLVGHAQKNLSAAEIDAIRNEQKFRIDLLTGLMGPGFTRDNLPKVFQMLDRVQAGASTIVEVDKRFFHTRRPYLADARVKLYVDRIDNSPAYPSGHTAESRVMAEVLAMLNPAKAAALRSRADEIAWRRVEAGAHYPNDLDGGRDLALLITGALVANDDFQDDLAIARREMAEK